ncbi:hypothetical protein GCM10009839_83800 [Catenulispora yoronensis]|uniref:Uncharacterized protein n=1 Tax=Catenulispora yoronensis TaxID=450799 RepID=A0ABP5H1G7_9ACTN
MHPACGPGNRDRRDLTDPRTPFPQVKEHLMADVVFVGLTIAFFGLLALIVKGVERLER